MQIQNQIGVFNYENMYEENVVFVFIAAYLNRVPHSLFFLLTYITTLKGPLKYAIYVDCILFFTTIIMVKSCLLLRPFNEVAVEMLGVEI